MHSVGRSRLEPYTPKSLPLYCIDWESHISYIGKANAALARYDGILQGIVNPRILLSPLMTNEAVLSSKIEGTRVTLEDVLQYDADVKDRFKPDKIADIHEVINYRKAMSQAIRDLETQPLGIKVIKGLHRILLSDVRGQDRNPGEIRKVQNFIGRTFSIESAIFVPPKPQVVISAMTNWEDYLYRTEVDPLVQLAVLKAQFELIHPFSDGNGRIGRMIVPLFLYYKQTLSSPMFYISSYLEKNRPTYYKSLLAISKDGDWDTWISFFLKAITEQSIDNSIKAKAIIDLYNDMKTIVPDVTHSQYSIQAIDALFSQPIFKSPHFTTNMGINRMAAQRILRELAKHDILDILIHGKARRPSVYAFNKLLDITEGRELHFDLI